MTLLEAAIFHCVWRFHGCGDALGSGSRKKILMTSLSMARVGQISSAGWGKSIQCCLLYIYLQKQNISQSHEASGYHWISLYIFIYTPYIYLYIYIYVYTVYISICLYLSDQTAVLGTRWSPTSGPWWSATPAARVTWMILAAGAVNTKRSWKMRKWLTLLELRVHRCLCIKITIYIYNSYIYITISITIYIHNYIYIYTTIYK